MTTVVYVLWASGEVQPWNNPEEYYAARDGAKLEASWTTAAKHAEANNDIVSVPAKPLKG